MSVPEAIAWLERSRDSKPPSAARVYATIVLDELKRLNDARDACARELEKREQLRQDAVSAHRGLETVFSRLDKDAKRQRDAWDVARQDLETRLDAVSERLTTAEGIFRDVHYGLLYQPELTREEIAQVITSVVTPYTPGERPHPQKT